jgi:hypothetical protein
MSLLPNQDAFRRVFEFQSFGMAGDDPDDREILDKYLESKSRGLIAFGSTRTGKTRAIFARLVQIHIWREVDFRWVRALDLAAEVASRSRPAARSSTLSLRNRDEA